LPEREDGAISLAASQATITTATVSIRTLRVSGRQLTQAVFRQLPVARLIDEEEVSILGAV
jgi:hypothetical protein